MKGFLLALEILDLATKLLSELRQVFIWIREAKADGREDITEEQQARLERSYQEARDGLDEAIRKARERRGEAVITPTDETGPGPESE